MGAVQQALLTGGLLPDLLFGSVRALLHFNGTTGLAGETVFDSSSYARTVSLTGVINTLGNEKFGSGGLYTVGGGGRSSNAQLDSSASLAIPENAAYALEFWLNPGLAAVTTYFFVLTSGAAHIWFYLTPDYKLGCYCLGYTQSTGPAVSLVPGTWYFISLVREAGAVGYAGKLYVDGVLLYTLGGDAAASGTPATVQLLSAPLVAGAGAGELVTLDEFRLTIGATRDGTVVPTGPFPDF